MRILLSAGGTAGHINPALAIANEIRVREPDSEIAFVCTKRDEKNSDLLQSGYPVYFVKSEGITRRLCLSNFRALFRAAFSPMYPSTRAILDEFRPNIVVGTGGYACWPILVAAARRGIPTAVHESNAIPGMTVKRLQKYVDRIFINFPNTAEYLSDSEKIMAVGNPLREAVGAMPREEAKQALCIKEPLLLISFGGSLGSQTVSDAVFDVMEQYTAKHPEIRHIHATGRANFDSANRAFLARQLERYPNLELRPYITEMPRYLSASDLVICRSGAMTTSELALTGRAAVMVPSPYVADNHQYRNANALAEKHAVCMVKESELATGGLLAATVELLESPEKRAQLETNIRAFATPDANRRLYEELCKLVSTKKH